MTALAGQRAEVATGDWRLVVWEEGRNTENLESVRDPN